MKTTIERQGDRPKDAEHYRADGVLLERKADTRRRLRQGSDDTREDDYGYSVSDAALRDELSEPYQKNGPGGHRYDDGQRGQAIGSGNDTLACEQRKLRVRLQCGERYREEVSNPVDPPLSRFTLLGDGLEGSVSREQHRMIMEDVIYGYTPMAAMLKFLIAPPLNRSKHPE